MVDTNKDTVIFINDGERHFWSATRAAHGMGWRFKERDILVYRLDKDASQTLTAAVDAAKDTWDYANQKTDKAAMENLKQIFQRITGIKRS